MIGSFECECGSGFTANGSACMDVNECATGQHNCTAPPICATSPGKQKDIQSTHSTSTLCCMRKHAFDDPRFLGIVSNSHIPMRFPAGPLCCLGLCSNNPGSYLCGCQPGFACNNTACVDTDECADNAHTCDSNAFCLNTHGSYRCECVPGYSGNGRTCDDINECFSPTRPCSQLCFNSIGSFTCGCFSGFTGRPDEGGNCTDVDECAGRTHSCHPNGTCINLVGHFACSCKHGFTGNGFSCSDLDECSE